MEGFYFIKSSKSIEPDLEKVSAEQNLILHHQLFAKGEVPKKKRSDMEKSFLTLLPKALGLKRKYFKKKTGKVEKPKLGKKPDRLLLPLAMGAPPPQDLPDLSRQLFFFSDLTMKSSFTFDHGPAKKSSVVKKEPAVSS